jgi:small subunit ribosomal protein S16
MLRIRLRRVGKKGKPSYRIVVAESTSPRDGRYVEWIGHYDPMADPPAISLKEDRALEWLKQGAQPSDAVKRILDKTGILPRTPVFRTITPSSPVEAPEASAPTVTVVAVAAPVAAPDDAPPTAEAEEPVAEAEETVVEVEEPVVEEPVVEEEAAVDESSEEAPAE